MRFIEIPALITEDIEDPSIVDITEPISVSISGTTMTINGQDTDENSTKLIVSGEATITLTGDTTVDAFTLQNIRAPSIHKISVKTNGKGNFTYVPNDDVTASSLSTTTKTGSDFEILLITTTGGETYVDFDMADYVSPVANFSNALMGFDISELTSTYGATAKLYKPDGTLLSTVSSATSGSTVNFGQTESSPGEVLYKLEVTDDLGRKSKYDLPRKWISYAMETNSTPGFEKLALAGNEYTSTTILPNLTSSSKARVHKKSDHGYLGINFKIQGRNSTNDGWVDIDDTGENEKDDESKEFLAFGDYLYHRVWVKPTAKVKATVTSSNVVALSLTDFTEENLEKSFENFDPYDIDETSNTYVFEEKGKVGTIPFTITIGDQTYSNSFTATTLELGEITKSYHTDVNQTDILYQHINASGSFWQNTGSIDGTWIAYCNSSSNPTFYKGSPETGYTLMQTYTASTEGSTGQLSYDGLYYIGNHHGNVNATLPILKRTGDTFAAHSSDLTKHASVNYGPIAWSPNSYNFVVTDTTNEKIYFYEFDAATETWSTTWNSGSLTSTIGDISWLGRMSTRLSKDGEYLITADHSPENARIWKCDWSAQTVTLQHTQTGASGCGAIDYDGEYAIVGYNTSATKILKRSGTTWTDVTTSEGFSNLPYIRTGAQFLGVPSQYLLTGEYNTPGQSANQYHTFLYKWRSLKSVSLTYNDKDRITITKTGGLTTTTDKLYKDGVLYETLNSESVIFISETGVYQVISDDKYYSNKITITTVSETEARLYINHATTFLLKKDGKVWYWGESVRGSNAMGNGTEVSLPTLNDNLNALPSGIKQIGNSGVDPHAMCAITNNGKLYTWGYNGHGGLGRNNTTNYENQGPWLVDTQSSNTFTFCHSSYYSNFALQDNGYLWSCGYNGQYLLGTGNNSQQNIFYRINLPNVIDFHANHNLAVAVTSSNEVYIWGTQSNSCMAGIGTTGTPTRLTALDGKNIVKVRTGGYSGHAISSDGKLYSWGKGQYYAIPYGTNGDVSTPTEMTWFSRKNIRLVDAQFPYDEAAACLALDDQGNMYVWGVDDHGVIGTSDGGFSPGWPILLKENIASISVGRHSCGCIDKFGQVYTWGDGVRGVQNWIHGTNSDTDINYPASSNLSIGTNLIYDGYDTLKLGKNSTATSTIVYGSNTLSLDTKSDIFITDPHTYTFKVSDTSSGTLTYLSNVASTVSRPTGRVYPPKSGTHKNLSTSGSANVDNTWTIDGALYGNGDYKASMNKNSNSSEHIYHAFSGVTGYGHMHTSSGNPTVTIQLHMPQKIKLTKYAMYSRNFTGEYTYAPRDWKVYGSNDNGTNWTELDSRTNQTVSSWGSQTDHRDTKREYTVSGNTKYFSSYKLDVTANGGNGNFVVISQIEYYGDEDEDFITYDGFSKVTVDTKGDTNATSNITYYSNTYEMGTARDLYIPDTGTGVYGANIYGSSKMFIGTHTVSADTIDNVPGFTLAFHHGAFSASDYSSAYSSVTAAATAGFVYSDTPAGTYSWGTLANVKERENPDFTANSTLHTDYSSTYGWTTNSGWEVSAKDTLSSTFEVWNAFNKRTYANNNWLSGSAPSTSSPQWLKIKYPSSQVIKSYVIRARENASPRWPTAWKLQGANTDIGNTDTGWTDIGSEQTQTEWAQGRSKSFDLSTNTTAYQYYRLRITGARESASSSNDDYVAIGQWFLNTVNDENTTNHDQYTRYAYTPPAASLTADVFMVAGGGGGGSHHGGGGGGGGVVYNTNQILSGQKSIVIGNGGEGGYGTGTTEHRYGLNGKNTYFSGLNAAIGGGGGSGQGNITSGGSGGSGGGSFASTVGGSPTTGQGYKGGDNVGDDGAAGGGGAGGAGSNNNGRSGGNGGLGINYTSTFGTTYGDSGWFSSGGGGGSSTNGGAGSASQGGGTNGSNTSSFITDADSHTGGGGGGSGWNGNNTAQLGGNGGSGIVIIKKLGAANPLPALNFDGYNKLTIDNVSSGSGSEWPPTDGTASSFSVSNSNRDATWTISGASYGNGTYTSKWSGNIIDANRHSGKAFNKIYGGNENFHTNGTGAGNLDLELPEAFIMGSYDMRHRSNINTNENAAPKDWVISGSNDGSTWTVLDTQTGQVYSPDVAPGGETLRSYTVTGNTTAYKHYRMYITSNDGGSHIIIGELRYYAQQTVATTSTIKKDGAAFATTTSNTVYIRDTGTYTAEVKGSGAYVTELSKVVTGSISSPTLAQTSLTLTNASKNLPTLTNTYALSGSSNEYTWRLGHANVNDNVYVCYATHPSNNNGGTGSSVYIRNIHTNETYTLSGTYTIYARGPHSFFAHLNGNDFIIMLLTGSTDDGIIVKCMTLSNTNSWTESSSTTHSVPNSSIYEQWHNQCKPQIRQRNGFTEIIKSYLYATNQHNLSYRTYRFDFVLIKYTHSTSSFSIENVTAKTGIYYNNEATNARDVNSLFMVPDSNQYVMMYGYTNSGSKNDNANAYGRLAKFTYDYGDGGTVSNYLEVGTTGSGRNAPGNRKYRSLIPLYDSSGNINEVLLWNSAHTQNVTQKVTLSNLSHSTVSYNNDLNVYSTGTTYDHIINVDNIGSYYFISYFTDDQKIGLSILDSKATQPTYEYYETSYTYGGSTDARKYSGHNSFIVLNSDGSSIDWYILMHWPERSYVIERYNIPLVQNIGVQYDGKNKLTISGTNYTDTTNVTYYSNTYELGTAKTMYVKHVGEYVFKISGTDKYVESNVYVSSVDLAGASTKPIDFDGYNKLTLIDAGSNVSANVTYFSNTYELGSANVLYINGAGTYGLEMSGSNVFALSNTVVGTVTQPITTGLDIPAFPTNSAPSRTSIPYTNSIGQTSYTGAKYSLTYNGDVYEITVDSEEQGGSTYDPVTSVFARGWHLFTKIITSEGSGGGTTTNYAQYNSANYTSVPAHVKIKLPSAKVAVGGFLRESRNNHISGFIIQGSNDDSTWTDLYTGTTVGITTGVTFTFSNSTAYQYYRLRVTSLSTPDANTYFRLDAMNIHFHGYFPGYDNSTPPSLTFDGYNKLTLENFTTTDKEWPPPSFTSPTFSASTVTGVTTTNNGKDQTWTISGASYGNGEYSATYNNTILSNANYHGPVRCFDKVNDGHAFHSSSVPTGIVTLNMPENIILSSYELRHRPNANTSENHAPRDWTLEASNDGTTWVVLDTQSNQSYNPDVQGDEASKRTYTISGNTTRYSRYRLNITANDGGVHLVIGQWKLFEKNLRTAKLTDPNDVEYTLVQTQNDIYIEETGDYFLEVTNSDQSAVVKKTVTGGISQAPPSVGSTIELHTPQSGSTLIKSLTCKSPIDSGSFQFSVNGVWATNAVLDSPIEQTTNSDHNFTLSELSIFNNNKNSRLTLTGMLSGGTNSKGSPVDREFVFEFENFIKLTTFTMWDGRSDWTYTQYEIWLGDDLNNLYKEATVSNSPTTQWDNNNNTNSSTYSPSSSISSYKYLVLKNFVVPNNNPNNNNGLGGLGISEIYIYGYVTSQEIIPSLTFDNYNKLSINNLTPTSSRLTYGSNTYDIGTASNVYIEHGGTYKMATGDANTFALVSNVVSAPVTRKLDYSSTETTINGDDLDGADNYGQAMCGYGDTVAIAAPGEDTGVSNSGAVYIWKRTGTTWTQEAKLKSPTPGSAYYFGFGQMSMIENKIAIGEIGANKVHVFTRSGTTWTLAQTLSGSNNFGRGVALYGNYLAVGADTYNSNRGRVHIYTLSSGTYGSEVTISSPHGNINTQFGYALSLYGTSLAVGAYADDQKAYQAGRAYIYVKESGGWVHQASLDDDLISNDYAHEVFLIDADTLMFGNYQLASSSNSGKVYYYTRSGITWTKQQTITASDGGTGDYFGQKIWATSDTLIVGARNWEGSSGTNRGKIYIYEKESGIWTEKKTYTKVNNAADSDYFGESVWTDGTYFIAGAMDADDKGTTSGSAHVYTKEYVGPTLTYDTSNKLSITGITPTATTLTDPFGSSLDIGTVTDVYIRDSGKYAIASKDANTFLLASNTVTGTPTGTYDKRVPLAFHHGTFADSGDPYSDGSVTVAATNGHVFADTAPGTYTWGTLGSASNTTTNSTYTWTPTSDITGSDVLMVAGGGGGGKQVGGGGGAGGLLHYTNQSLSGQKTIVVGNGGIGGDYGNGTTAYSGNNTTFTGLDDAIGGGHGVSYNGIAGSTGGSGGGGGGGSTNGYAGTTGQGNAGGSGYDSSWAGGGGGGAGGVGQNSSANTGGVGGVGVDKSSVFGTTYGVSGWFAGGGGGCSQTGTGGGAGGQGGGGRGGNNAGTAEGVREKGVDHTGGGGGGSRDGKGGSPTSLDPYGYETGDGGNGGSGIVLMMLPITATTPSQTYDTTKTITVSNVPAGTSTVGNIYKGSTAYPIHATTSTSNVIIKNTGTYLSVFTTATQAFLTNAIDVSTQPTATSEDNTIEDEAPLSASVSATLVFHHDTFANSDDPHGDGSITTAATNGHVYSDTPTGTYSWGTLGSATLNQPSGTDTSAGSGGHTPGNTTYTWTPPGTITGARMLLVGGGGGGGMNMGGGGGAGGFLAIASKDISASEQTVVVGRGGIGAPGQNQTNILGQQQGSDNNSYNTPAYNGGDSSISGETAYGGGRGGYSHNNDDRQHGGNGGSGGGVSGYGSGGRNNPGGTGVSGQGNTGGSSNTSHYSGGGGGAGEAGASANSEPKGGDGLSSDILGTEYWWSGGGGGGGYTINGGDGGKGGGGGGAVGTNPGGTGGLTAGGAGGGGSTNIQTNTPGGHAGKHTGGGGGGGAHYQGNNYGGNGGSGIVILKFVAQDADLAGSTAVPDQTTTIVIGEEAPSETLDVSTTTIQEPTLNLDFTVATTKLARNVKRYNGLSNSSIGARFNRRESRKKRIEKSISIPSSFSAELTANNASSPTTLTVTVSNSRFYINGESKPTLGFIRGETYTFDQSDSSNSGHPLVLATSKDGVQYTTGWVNNVFTVPYDVPDTIYYKCSNHNNMGGEIHTTFGTAFSLGDFDIAANTHVSGEYTLAVNYDGTTSNLYVNGSLITQTTPTISVGTKEFILGKEFDGYVKNFKFWNYAKSFLVLHATGGTITYITGYVVHTFTSSGNFVTPSGRDVEYLVVAGGGGGGFGHAGGGGGAGGFVDGSVTVSTGTFPVVVGTGGAGSTVASVKGGYGTNSSFNGIIGLGGGGGGSRNTSNATNGGSGGGGSRVSGTAGSATQPSSSSSGYGNNGGTGAGGGSGGGGAGGVGENGGDEGTVSVGGVGKISTISGNSLYYAAGGGGGTGAGVSDYAAPASGIGGRGGSLSASGSLLNGQVNTGSGGGGAGNNVAGGDGGSGIVIIRYIA